MEGHAEVFADSAQLRKRSLKLQRRSVAASEAAKLTVEAPHRLIAVRFAAQALRSC